MFVRGDLLHLFGNRPGRQISDPKRLQVEKTPSLSGHVSELALETPQKGGILECFAWSLTYGSFLGGFEGKPRGKQPFWKTAISGGPLKQNVPVKVSEVLTCDRLALQESRTCGPEA